MGAHQHKIRVTPFKHEINKYIGRLLQNYFRVKFFRGYFGVSLQFWSDPQHESETLNSRKIKFNSKSARVN